MSKIPLHSYFSLNFHPKTDNCHGLINFPWNVLVLNQMFSRKCLFLSDWCDLGIPHVTNCSNVLISIIAISRLNIIPLFISDKYNIWIPEITKANG